jgi:hypothetical protein
MRGTPITQPTVIVQMSLRRRTSSALPHALETAFNFLKRQDMQGASASAGPLLL